VPQNIHYTPNWMTSNAPNQNFLHKWKNCAKTAKVIQ